MAQYAVLLAELGALAPEQLAPIFESVLGMVRYDALRTAKMAGGILAERLDDGPAAALVAACAEAGAEALQVPQPDMVQVGKPVISRKFQCDEDALRVHIGYTGAPRVLPWAGVRLLSAATLAERSLGPAPPPQKRKRRGFGFGKRMALDALLPGLGSVLAASAKRRAKKQERADRRLAAVRSGEPHFIEVADCFAADADGEMLHIRWRGPELYYGDILGDARAGDVHTDFRQVLEAIARHARAALVTPALHALLFADDDPGVDAAEAAFESEHAFGEYNRWQLQLLALDPGES